jgi:hypothetical protein
VIPLPRRIAGTIVIVIALAIGGCGGGDEERKTQNAYVSDVNEVQSKFSTAYSRIASQITSTTSAREDRATVSQLERTLDDTVAQLRAVKAPSEVAKLHGELVGVLQGYSTALGELTDDLLSRSRTRVARATTLLATETSDASSDFSHKINEINEQLRD